MTSAAGRPTVGALPRRHAWGALLCLSLVGGLLFLPAAPANAASFIVTTVDDAGPGSLRQAILDANLNPGADDIAFAIPGGGAKTITPNSPLPAITEQVNLDASTQGSSSCAAWPPTLLVRLEGSSAGAGTAGLTIAGGTGTTIKGFIIRRFAGDGVSLMAPASATTVVCNAIGTTPDGGAQQGVGGAGVAVRSTDQSATDPTIITNNIVMNNGGAGVLVDPSARLVAIRDNRIDTNLGIGIDLVAAGGPPDGDGPTANGATGPGAGGNDLQFTPVLSVASSGSGSTSVTGSLDVPATVEGRFVIEFFVSPSCDADPAPGGAGEGARPIGSISIPAAATSGPSTVPFAATSLSNVNVGSFVTATATDGFGSGNTSEFSRCAEVVAGSGAASADLSVRGTVSPDPAQGGGALAYALTVHDEGPDPAAGAVLVSELPPGLVLDTMTTSAGSCAATVFTVTCDLGTVSPRVANDVLVTIGVIAQDIAGDLQLDNHVSVGSTTADPDPTNNETIVSGMVRARRFDLSIDKSGPAQVAPGDVFSYTIAVSNGGPGEARSVTATDSLPAGVTFEAATPSAGTCDAASGTVTCMLGTLAAGAAATVDIQVSADAPPGADPVVISNIASVASDRPDLDPSDDTSSPVLTTVVAAGTTDLSLTSVVNVPDPVTGGYDLGSTATVTNAGPGDATDVTLTDTLAPGVSFVPTGSDPSCSAIASAVTCAVGDLASGESISVLVVTKTPVVEQDTTLHDRFAIDASGDGTPDNDTLDVATIVRARRADFVAGYVPQSSSTTWLTDATEWSILGPVATSGDPSVALVGIPGGGPGGPVIVTERPCVAPFVCMSMRRGQGGFLPISHGTFGSLVAVSVPDGYGATNPVTGVFLDDWSVVGWGWDWGHGFQVSYVSETAVEPTVLPSCGGWRRATPPCVASISRSFAWWSPPAFADLRTVVRFTAGGTIARGR